MIGKKEIETLAKLYSGVDKEDSFFDEVERHRQSIADSIDKLNDDSNKEKKHPLKVTVKDAFGNSLLSVGNDDKIQKFNTYGFSNNSLNYPLWLALYNDSWVFRKAIDKPAQDQVKCGVILKGTNDKSKVYAQYRKDKTSLTNLLKWGALFGGSIGVMMYDNLKDEDYQNPMDSNKLKQAKTQSLYITDRWFGVAQVGSDTVEEMESLDFGKPKMYEVMFADGHTIKVHHDYILRYEHRDAPKFIKTGVLQGWGYAEGSHILAELARDDKLKTSITSLIDKALIEVIQMPGMRGLYMGAASEEEEKQLMQRVEMVNWARNFNSLTLLDKDDTYTQNQLTAISGLAELMSQNFWLVAAAVDMPGILFGDLKSGLSSDADALERYADVIHDRCDDLYRPVLTKYLKTQYIRFGITDTVEFEFDSLIKNKQDEKRMDGLKHYQELLSGMLQDGVIDAKRYAQSMADYTTKGVIDFHLDDDYIEGLNDKIHEEMESINPDEPDEPEDEIEVPGKEG